MEEIKLKENCSFRDINLSPSNKTQCKNKPNRHVSVLYNMQYLTKVPVVKRCRKTEYECFANINKKQIFTFVYKFVNKIIQCDEYLKKVLVQMKFSQNEIDPTIIRHQVKNTSALQNVGSSFFNNENILHQINEQKCIKLDNTLKVNKSKSCKKISIMIQGFNDFDDVSSGSALFSDQSIHGISSVNITLQEFNLKMVQKIYQQPQPFLINLSVCLMLKFLYCSQMTLTNENVCWILSVGTIVAYKIYYDQPVCGLIDSFAYILKVKPEDIINLQRYFLGKIDHEAVISNQQYHNVLYQMIKQGSI